MAIEFYEGDAPATVENFKKLARASVLQRPIAFHRAFPHVLVQVGDPFSRGRDRSKVGTGGPGYTLPPEIRRKHTVGAVAMARLPDKINPSRLSNGSQFFVCLAPMPTYDGQYTVFGHVIYGLEVLDADLERHGGQQRQPNPRRCEIRILRILPREQLPGRAAAAVRPGRGATAKPAAKKAWWKVF